LAVVKEGPADCIKIDPYSSTEKMKSHKAPGLSGLVAEMIQATEDTGTQWILDLCNGIVKEGCMPQDWKSSVVLPICKKVTQLSVYLRGIKLLEDAIKVVERSLNTEFGSRLRQMSLNL